MSPLENCEHHAGPLKVPLGPQAVQGWPVECGQNVHLARGLIFASVLKVFEGVGAIWEGPDGAPPGSQGGPRPPPQNTTISLRQGAFGV